jgi:prevent-host-death family protein
MAEIIAQRILRNDNAAIIERVVHGESFIVTRNGRPVAEVRPIIESRHRLVSKDELRAAFVGVGPRLDGATLRRDLDAALDQRL